MEMTEVRAVVKALEGDIALVEIKQGGCGRCHEEGGCGGHHLTQALCSAPKIFRVYDSYGVAIGDEVILGLPARSVVFGANLAYVFPVFALLAGALLGSFFHGDRGAILGGFFGILLSWAFMRWKMRPGLENPDFQPKILNLVQQERRR